MRLFGIWRRSDAIRRRMRFRGMTILVLDYPWNNTPSGPRVPCRDTGRIACFELTRLAQGVYAPCRESRHALYEELGHPMWRVGTPYTRSSRALHEIVGAPCVGISCVLNGESARPMWGVVLRALV